MNFYQKIKIKLRNRWNDYDFKRKFLIVLFILNFLCFLVFIPIISSTTSVTKLPFAYNMHYWIVWLFIPIPLLSIILGKKYKKLGYHCKKNIVAGIIVLFYLIWMGSSFLTTNNLYDDDYQMVLQYENIIGVKLPKKAQVENMKEMQSISFSSNVIVKSSSYVHFYKSDYKKMNEMISNNQNWQLQQYLNSDIQNLISLVMPTMAINDGYYSIYIEETNKYNEMPGENGTYNIYIMYYDSAYHDLGIDKISYFKS